MNEINSRYIETGREYAGTLVSAQETLFAWGRFFDHPISQKKQRVPKTILLQSHQATQIEIKIKSKLIGSGWIFITNEKIILYRKVEDKLPPPYEGQSNAIVDLINTKDQDLDNLVSLESHSDASRLFLKRAVFLVLNRKIREGKSSQLALSFDDEYLFHTIKQIYLFNRKSPIFGGPIY